MLSTVQLTLNTCIKSCTLTISEMLCSGVQVLHKLSSSWASLAQSYFTYSGCISLEFYHTFTEMLQFICIAMFWFCFCLFVYGKATNYTFLLNQMRLSLYTSVNSHLYIDTREKETQPWKHYLGRAGCQSFCKFYTKTSREKL